MTHNSIAFIRIDLAKYVLRVILFFSQSRVLGPCIYIIHYKHLYICVAIDAFNIGLIFQWLLQDKYQESFLKSIHML